AARGDKPGLRLAGVNRTRPRLPAGQRVGVRLTVSSDVGPRRTWFGREFTSQRHRPQFSPSRPLQ
ncbi:MAG: hypothetical protein ACLP8X_21600, partial [Streptosporangiaceae bacterium]